MAENDNGRLNFSVGIDLDELRRGSEEAVRQFDGIAAEARAKGADIDRAFGTDAARGASSLSSAVRQSLSDIGKSCSEHEAAIAELEGEYSRLGREMSKAYETGRDGDLSALQERAAAVKAEISVRKELLSGLREQADALEAEAAKIEESRRQTDDLGESHSSLRQRIRELQEQMAQLREQGIDETSGAYRELTAELGRLRDIQSDIQKQGSVLANDQAQFQGVISGLQGVTGGYSALSGVMGLFGAKNEELNRIMAKAQSLMSITIGLQQVSQMLDKDSAFQLTTVAKVREWWNKLLDVGRGKTTANTAAVELNTAAQKGNSAALKGAGAAQQFENVAAETGTAANIGLAGAFRMVGAAIKSIPVFGWIAAALSAIVSVVSHFVSKAKEARKAADEFNQAVAEIAAEPVSAMMKLRAEWASLGDDMEAKQRFVEESQKAFEDLGLSIKDVNDAEAVLTSDETLNKYIKAQLMRAKADEQLKKIRKEVEKLNKMEADYEAMPDTVTVQGLYSPTVGSTGTTAMEVSNEKAKENAKAAIKEQKDVITGMFTQLGEYNKETDELFKEMGINTGKAAEATAKPVEGSIDALQAELKEQQDLMNKAVINSEEYIEAQKRVNELQAQLEAVRGKTSATNADKEAKELENALTREGKIMESLTRKNEQNRIAQIGDAHEQRMEEIKYDYEQEMAEIERQTGELRKANEITGVQTIRAGEGVPDWQVGLTSEQIKAIEDAQKLASKKMETAVEEENARVKAEAEKATNDLLKGIETYEQKWLKIEQEYEKRRDALYDDDGDLRNGVTEENLELLYEAYLDEMNSLSIDALKDVCDELEKLVLDAQEELDALEESNEDGENNEKIAAAMKKVENAINKCKKAQDKYNNSKDNGNDKDDDTEDNNEQLLDSFGKLAKEIGNVGDAFEELGDAIGGSTGEALSDIGKVCDGIESIANSIINFVEQGIQGIETATTAATLALKSVESASAILAMIGAVMQIATVIASLFNNDDRKQEEIDALQDRIDQLQWELDNAGAARVRDATGGALSVTSELYRQALKDAKTANKEGKSYISMLSEWTQAADKATAADVAHEKTVQGIIKTYTNLGYTVDKAIGEDKYKKVGDEVRNYAEQLALIQEQYELEQSKKKTDTDKLKEYEQQMDEIAQSMVDTLNSAVEDIIGGSYEDISKQLGDAFVEAFQAGEDAAEAWGDTVEDIVNDIVRQMLIQQWIEPKIAEIFDKYMSKWYNIDSEGNLEYAGNQAVVDSMAEFSEELNGAMDEFAVQWEAVSEAMGWAAESTREAATRGIAAASQESIDELNGRMTAIQGHTYAMNDNVAILVTTNNLILQSVVNIESNTDRLVAALEEAEDTADDIRGLMDDMMLKGLKVK